MSYLVNDFNSGLGISSMYFLGDTTTYLTDADLTAVYTSLSNYETKTAHNGDISNLNTGISNNSSNITTINTSLSNYETKTAHNADIANLNTGYSNNSSNITTINTSLSNYETKTAHNADIANLNTGYSNNASSITTINTSLSNYITASSSNTLINKTIDYNSNSILNLPTGGTPGLGLTLLNTVSFIGGTQTVSGISSSYKHLFIWFKDVRNYSSVDRNFRITFNSTNYIVNNGQIYLRGFMKIYNSGIVSNKYVEHTINQTQSMGCDVNTTTTAISTLVFDMTSETNTAGTIYILGAN